MTTKEKSRATWSDAKAKLVDLDRTALLELVHDLYAASKDNQAFLHARLGSGDDPLKPYKTTISRWICPNVMRGQKISVAKGKKAITDYKKAVGRSDGLAELAIFYCEEVVAFLDQFGMDDQGYYSAFERMFEQALKMAMTQPDMLREAFLDQLEDVRAAAQAFGWGVGDALNQLWRDAGLEIGS